MTDRSAYPLNPPGTHSASKPLDDAGQHREPIPVRLRWSQTTLYEADTMLDPCSTEAEILQQLDEFTDTQRRVITGVETGTHLVSVVDLDGDGRLDALELSTSVAQVDDWGELADRIDERIAESPSWPRLNAALNAAARDGVAVAAVFPILAAQAALPAHDPAAELHARLANARPDVTSDVQMSLQAQPHARKYLDNRASTSPAPEPSEPLPI